MAEALPTFIILSGFSGCSGSVCEGRINWAKHPADNNEKEAKAENLESMEFLVATILPLL
jgi:hypothetical protein